MVGFKDKKNVLTVPAAAFGFGVTKMHKKTQDILRRTNYELLLKESKVFAKDDQRSIAFLATHDSAFGFPVASDPNSNFDNREFETALARKMGIPVKFLLPYVGSRVRSNGNFEIPMLRSSIRMIMAVRSHRTEVVSRADDLSERRSCA